MIRFVNYDYQYINTSGYDRDDCTVRSLSNSLNISYDFADAIYKKVRINEYGQLIRRERDITIKTYKLSVNVINLNNYFFGQPIDLGSLNLLQFIVKYNRGTYVTIVNGHITTIHDGNVVEVSGSSGIDFSTPLLFIYQVIDNDLLLNKLKLAAELCELDFEQHYFPMKREANVAIQRGNATKLTYERTREEYAERYEKLKVPLGLQEVERKLFNLGGDIFQVEGLVDMNTCVLRSLSGERRVTTSVGTVTRK